MFIVFGLINSLFAKTRMYIRPFEPFSWNWNRGSEREIALNNSHNFKINYHRKCEKYITEEEEEEEEYIYIYIIYIGTENKKTLKKKKKMYKGIERKMQYFRTKHANRMIKGPFTR